METKSKVELRVEFLGSFSMQLDGQKISTDNWKSKKALTLFKYLVWNRGKKIPKDIIMELLWPNNDKDRSSSLHTTVYFLRKTLKLILEDNKDCCQINYAKGFYWCEKDDFSWVDCEVFEYYCHEGIKMERKAPDKALYSFQQALSLYNGDFLDDELYEDWTMEPRRCLHELYIDTILRTATLISNLQHNYIKAAQLCQEALKIDPYREEIYQAIIFYFIRSEKYVEASKKYQQYKEMLYDNFGLDPSPETQELFYELNKLSNKAANLSKSSTKPKQGFFYCDKHTFETMYELELRKQKRSKEIFTLVSIYLDQKIDIEAKRKKILKRLATSFRKGDVGCIWDERIILIQLFQSGYEQVKIIKKRLNKILDNNLLGLLSIEFHVIDGSGKEIALKERVG